MNLWVIIPVKALEMTKSRLGAILSPSERMALTRFLLVRLLDVLGGISQVCERLVVSRDPTIRALAERVHGRAMSETMDADLNGAVTQAAQYARGQGATHCLILPTDLPLLQKEDLLMLLEGQSADMVVISSDRWQEGTNALLIPTRSPFRFQYGAQSFQRHLREAQRLGLEMRVVDIPHLQFDLDTVADWEIYQQLSSLCPER